MSNVPKKYATTFFSQGFDSMVICPVDGCTHSGQVITKAHCRIEHGMTRDEVAKKYGHPEVLKRRGEIINSNNVKRWNSVSNTTDL